MTTTLVTASEGVTLSDANNILRDSKKGKLPIVDAQSRLVSLLARSDLLKSQTYPLTSKRPESKKLYSAAAIGTRPADRDRLALLVEAGLDIVVIDSSQGNSIYQVEVIQWIKRTYPTLEMGSGSIYITQEVMDVGRPQATAVYAVSEFAPRLVCPLLLTAASQMLVTSPRPSLLAQGP
jgi:IMP dehydrogenase